jgi:tRNA U34 2-thiouridine synthase MnmA/TrmU
MIVFHYSIQIEIDKLQYDDLFVSLRIDFSSPVRAAVPGQILVLYKGDICLGGGAIQYSYSAYFDHIS